MYNHEDIPALVEMNAVMMEIRGDAGKDARRPAIHRPLARLFI